MQAIQQAVPDRYYALVRVMAVAGLRVGEALGLDVASIDFLRRTVAVEQQYTQAKTLTPPKGGETRSIAVPQGFLDDLAAHLAAFPSEEAVFTDERGERLSYRLRKPIWAAAAKEAGLAGRTHDLRHYCASALISGGASVV